MVLGNSFFGKPVAGNLVWGPKASRKLPLNHIGSLLRGASGESEGEDDV